jgi:hypothetical protein
MADNTPQGGSDTIATDDIGGVKYQRVKMNFGADGSATDVSNTAPMPAMLRDASGAQIDSLSAGGSSNGMMVALGATNFFPSSANSSSAQLAAAATFTGTIETIYNAQTISILARSDQNGTLTIKQYVDAGGTQVISTWIYNLTASVPFSRSFVGNGNYFNVTFQNTGGSTTTTFVLNTAYGILPSSTNLGNAPVSLDEVSGTAFSLGAQTIAGSLPVNISTDTTVTQAASIAALNVDLLTGGASGWYDAASFHSCSIQIIGAAGISAGAIFFEQTNDTTNAAAGNIWPVEEDTSATPTPNIAAITISASTTRMFRGMVTSRYVRVRVSTAFAGGTVKAVGVFSQMPFSRLTQTVHQATGANLNTAISSIAAGSLMIGDVGLQFRGNATGAASVSKVLTTASTNATSLKASAARLVGFKLTNTTASVKVIHFHNLATAPTVGTTSPTFSIVLPANTYVPWSNNVGDAFGSGLSYSITGGIADLDATATAVGDVIGSISWA